MTADPLAFVLRDLREKHAAGSDDSAGASQSAERETIAERILWVMIAVLKRCSQSVDPAGATPALICVKTPWSRNQTESRAIRLQKKLAVVDRRHGH